MRLHRRALAISEKVLGPEHPRTTLILTNLGETLTRLGQRAEAETLLLRSLHAREAALGPAHPDVGVSLADLASLYRDEKRYDEAEPLFRRAQALLEAAYPKGHPRLTQLLRSLRPADAGDRDGPLPPRRWKRGRRGGEVVSRLKRKSSGSSFMNTVGERLVPDPWRGV